MCCARFLKLEPKVDSVRVVCESIAQILSCFGKMRTRPHTLTTPCNQHSIGTVTLNLHFEAGGFVDHDFKGVVLAGGIETYSRDMNANRRARIGHDNVADELRRRLRSWSCTSRGFFLHFLCFSRLSDSHLTDLSAWIDNEFSLTNCISFRARVEMQL